MKKVLISLAVVAILAIGVAVYAQGSGWGGNYGHPGYGYHTMGTGYGGPMMGWRGGGYDQKYLDETADVRKELNTKRFEYFEAIRNPKTDPETVTKLENEIGNLQSKLYAKTPQGTNRGFAMPCWQF
jgi:hypothetical protein